jgi:hypothetical protein
MAETHPYEPDVRIPDGANDDGDGIVVGHGPIVVDAYIDFLCPFCRQFEERSGPTLERLVEEEAISLVYASPSRALELRSSPWANAIRSGRFVTTT